MTEEEYQALIPIFCKYPTIDLHAECLMFCWSISSGFLEKANRGIEGPQFCHECDQSFRAKRWDRVWYNKIFGKEKKC